MSEEHLTTTESASYPVLQGNQYGLQSADPAAIAAAENAKQRLQAAFIMAKQFPRDSDQARHKILAACRRPRFAEAAEYKKPIGGGKHINGASIRLAELCLREWGNVMTETNVVYEDEDSRRISVTVIDLETNTRFTKEIRITKTIERKDKRGRDVISERRNTYNDIVYIVRATDDEMMIKEAAHVSKAIRNEGLRCIPQDILEEAIDTSRATMSGQYTEDPANATRKLLDAFAEKRVTPKMLAEYLGHKTDTISIDEWTDLRLLYRGLTEGARWQDVVERKTRASATAVVEDEDDDDDPTSGKKTK